MSKCLGKMLRGIRALASSHSVSQPFRRTSQHHAARARQVTQLGSA